MVVLHPATGIRADPAISRDVFLREKLSAEKTAPLLFLDYYSSGWGVHGLVKRPDPEIHLIASPNDTGGRWVPDPKLPGLSDRFCFFVSCGVVGCVTEYVCFRQAVRY